MKTSQTHRLVLLSILTALTVVLGYLHVPTLTGFVTLLDAGIFFTAFYLGSKEGAVVGGLSGLLIDLLLGYPQWAFFSFLFHGLQGYTAGWTGKRQILGLILATAFMVGGYFLATTYMYNLGSALSGVVFNLIQNMLGMIVGWLLAKVMTGVRKVDRR